METTLRALSVSLAGITSYLGKNIGEPLVKDVTTKHLKQGICNGKIMKTVALPLFSKSVHKDWTWKRLDQISEIFDCPHSTPTLVDDCSAPFVARSQDIRSGYFNLQQACRVSQETYLQRIARAIPGCNDILYSREGTYFGIAAGVPQGIKVCLGQRMVLIRPIIESINPVFLRYWLNSPQLSAHIHGFRDGSVAERLNLPTIRALPIAFPCLSSQDSIANILKSLDDRIQLLRETNATLEAMAQALFKSWFVDFDPVYAKAEGRTPEGMDAETVALFPAEFEESELGMIPKGWKVVSFADTVSILSGGTPKTNIQSYWNGSIPWFSVVDAPRQSDVFVIDTEKGITEAAIESSSAKILPAGTTIISARGTVGKLAITACQMSMNQSCYGLQGVYGDVYFTYFNTLRLVDALKCRTHGSVFDTITRSTFEGVTSIKPQSPMVALFESSVSPLMERIKENLMLARTLTALRDTLLPRLISGKLRLPEFAETTNAKA